MPQEDRTGPMGQGSGTGWGRGLCGSGTGTRFRKGYIGQESRRCWTIPVELSKEDQKKILESELKELEIDKQEIEKRLKEIEVKE